MPNEAFFTPQLPPLALPPPPACTSEQRSTITSHLCRNRNRCGIAPLNRATRCPNPTWYDSYYEILRKRLKEERASFFGMYIGCNKGYDAVNTLRLGTGKKKYNKSEWRGQMSGGGNGVCGQANGSEIPLEEESEVIDGTVHCIEALPVNAEALRNSVKNLGWDDELLVKGIAMSDTNGEIYFPNKNDMGAEGFSIADCEKLGSSKFQEANCTNVSVTTLDSFMENTQKKDADTIHFLSIDVEGFDFDVMKGGTQTLARTEYLEFEYHSVGHWAKQSLQDAIKMLDGLGFTCYWAGVDKLWRLEDSCWLDHYHIHVWSNVACVNRKLNKQLAINMENTFLKTLAEKN